jgi:hypothetical protein
MNKTDMMIHDCHTKFKSQKKDYLFYVKDSDGIWGAFECPVYENHQNKVFLALIDALSEKYEPFCPYYRVIPKDIFANIILSGRMDLSMDITSWYNDEKCSEDIHSGVQFYWEMPNKHI